MTAANTSDAPIYDALVQEHGDVAAAARRVAEQAQRDVREAMDFSALYAPGGDRGRRPSAE
ncbi:hypothetical protein V1J52_02885 [Streptomyces sp. TRM 70351]|uniref:hypothetical protein n=1 Tax=Streptomyces sp. TRM 70351 TaxID=3116552 RepID=UPI002E7B5A1E|nr:hypothetical protein [Streptomyces sp. TRM 70351]MEE1927135.1 hypothetical protein [Streptomyces sp. TRM 70351]